MPSTSACFCICNNFFYQLSTQFSFSNRFVSQEFFKLVEWADKEGWNPGPYDAEVYWATDPDGYYGYKVDGELVAGGSIVSYNGEFGFMGFFIVKPEYRSKGMGRQLWYQRRDTLIERLNKEVSSNMKPKIWSN